MNFYPVLVSLVHLNDLFQLWVQSTCDKIKILKTYIIHFMPVNPLYAN